MLKLCHSLQPNAIVSRSLNQASTQSTDLLTHHLCRKQLQLRMDLQSLKTYIEKTLELIEMSHSQFPSFKILQKEDGFYQLSIMINSNPRHFYDHGSQGHRKKSKASQARNKNRRDEFLKNKKSNAFQLKVTTPLTKNGAKTAPETPSEQSSG